MQLSVMIFRAFNNSRFLLVMRRHLHHPGFQQQIETNYILVGNSLTRLIPLALLVNAPLIIIYFLQTYLFPAIDEKLHSKDRL